MEMLLQLWDEFDDWLALAVMALPVIGKHLK
jgi:hypothetical protein